MRIHPFLSCLFATSLLLAPASQAAQKKKKKPVSVHKPEPAPAPSKRETGEDDDDMELAAKGAIVIEAISGKTLFEKNADARFYPASTTKIMTGLLIIEAGNLDAGVEVNEEDARVGESSLAIKPGQVFSRRQMLYGLLLKSANDVAHALGRDNGGSIDAFAEKMNQRAKELGCTNTHFTNPHGLHNSAHYTTPRDLALIARAAMHQPLFRQIVASRHAEWSTGTGAFMLTNHNRLLDRFTGCNGVKTGYTIPAQQVLASSAARGGREAIAVVMHTDKPGIWEDSAKLLEFGLRQPPINP